VNEFGASLFDLKGIGQCPIDDSFQTEAVMWEARKRELARVMNRAALAKKEG
jgi:hypothetical protein